jgi:23S rRNA (uracil1939-C5)-methyltransferase
MATFARDLGEFLKSGYELRTVQPVDLFPHTAHIEAVSLLQRK